jgi:hypothetical protein
MMAAMSCLLADGKGVEDATIDPIARAGSSLARHA